MPPPCHVVIGSVVRLTLSDGNWIDVKSELNAGEYWDWIEALSQRQPFAKLLTYVLAWSLVGPDGTPLPWTPDLDPDLRRTTIRALDKAFVREMLAAIDKHEQASEAAVAAKKKTPDAAPASSATSPSAGS